jgi:hypothetical protein
LFAADSVTLFKKGLAVTIDGPALGVREAPDHNSGGFRETAIGQAYPVSSPQVFGKQVFSER